MIFFEPDRTIANLLLLQLLFAYEWLTSLCSCTYRRTARVLDHTVQFAMLIG